jgi:hypothetical protein
MDKDQEITEHDGDLKKYCVDRMKKMFDEVLFNVESAVRSDYQFSVLRKRILRSGNNAMRDIVREMDYYDVVVNPDKTKMETFKAE